MKTKVRVIIFIILALFSITIILLVLLYPLKITNIPYSTVIYDKNHVEIWEIPFENNYRHRDIKFEEIPNFYIKSIVSLEDQSFYYNIWISPRWILRSLINNVKSRKIVEWWSTISTQFIRNNLWLNEKRNLSKKFLEFFYAINLNIRYSKEDILTKYSNQLYFWYLNYWLSSASNYYFNKEVNNLTKAELLSLITIQKNSSKYDPYKSLEKFNSRFLLLAKTLKNNWIIEDKEFKNIINEKLYFNKNHENKLPYITDFINNSGNIDFLSINNSYIKIKWTSLKWRELVSKIETTIDYNLTRKIEDIATKSILDLAWKNVWDYGILILDKNTNELLTMIWGKNFYWKEWQVNSTLALRQPWSTIKPFNYLLASKMFWVEPNDAILDLPILYKTKDNYSYVPKNYSNTFEWEVSIWEALAQSMNVPAIKTLEKVWVNNLLEFLHKIGISSLNKDADHYWLALTLWDWEVSLYELTRAYSIFANEGKICDIKYLQSSQKKCFEVIESNYTDKIKYILSNRFLKLWGYPINSALDFENIDVFFKTWTSRNYRDNWTVWFTSNYIIWVWVGNKDASNMKWVSWATWAWEIFWKIVRNLEKTNSYTKLNNSSETISNNYLEITSPLNWEKYKINEYTQLENQKIKLDFSSNYQFNEYIWYLDDKKTESKFIILTPGKHKIRLELIYDWKIIISGETNYEVEN